MASPDLSQFSSGFAAVVADAGKRVVAIRGGNGGTISGIAWDEGLVITAHEALGDEEELAVAGADGAAATARVAGRDPTTDVALLRAEGTASGPWTTAAVPQVGSLAVLVGRGAESVIAGLAMVREVGPAWQSMRGGEIDARITLQARVSGRSEGSAVVDTEGRLIGMLVTGVRRSALVIPAATLARAVKTLSEKGYVPRGYLGVGLSRLASGCGAIITGVEAGGPAAAAGFRIGDVITTWNGEPVGSVLDVSNRLSTGAVGSKAKIGVDRAGSAHELEVTIGERPRG
jgi:S1-C subfamily serine protease